MGIVSHEYRLFNFASRQRPDASGGTIQLTVVPKAPTLVFANEPTNGRVVAKHGLGGFLTKIFTGDPNEVRLKIDVDGKTTFSNGGYKISGLTKFDGILHSVEIYVSAKSAETDYVKLTQYLPPLTMRLPNKIV